MKIFIIIANILIGLVLIFLNVNNILYLANLATQSSDNQYYYGVSLSRGFAEAIFWTIVGIFSIVTAFAFRKDKHWATLTLPLPTLALFLYIIYILFSSTKSDLAWTGGIMTIGAIILLVFLILEILYLTLKKPAQLS